MHPKTEKYITALTERDLKLQKRFIDHMEYRDDSMETIMIRSDAQEIYDADYRFLNEHLLKILTYNISDKPLIIKEWK